MPNITNPTFDPNKVAGDPISNTDQNTQNAAERRIHLNMQELINGIGAPSSTFTDDINSIEGRVQVLETYTVLTAKGQYTKDHGGFHGDIIYKDADEIVIKVKAVDGLGAWVGAILNDGTYLELTSDYTLKYDTPGNSGMIVDGITAKLNNEWFLVWAYEDAGGALAFAITWMPNTTFSNANPTNTLTLVQVNAQDIGLLFPVSSHLVCWQDTDEWETPLAWQNAGAVTYDATKDKPKVSSRTSTVLTLGANLENNNFIATSAVYQVDGFKPLQVSDGAIASAIGARGYKDTGFRFRTDGAGAIYSFYYSGNFIYFASQGAAWAGFGVASEALALNTYIPPDAKYIIGTTSYGGGGYRTESRLYYEATTRIVQYTGAGTVQMEIPVLHKLSHIQIGVPSTYYTHAWRTS